MKFTTRAIHVGQDADPATGATIVPIYQTSTYTQSEIGKHKGFDYSRTINPTRVALEQQLASLEGARYGSAFASGMAATSAVLGLLSAGDHVVVGDDLYGGTYRLFSRVLERYGVSFTYVDARDLAAIRAAITPATKLFWIETPSNPLMKIIDIAGVAGLLRDGQLLAVDNTFATPYFQQPLALGAHIVVHSTTKYIGGHSDVVGGVVITDDPAVHEQIRFLQNAAGAVPSPHDAWLTMRGAKTLALRMREHAHNAQQVAEFLGRTQRRGGGTLPRTPVASTARFGPASDERLRGHAFVRPGGPGGAHLRICQAAEVLQLSGKLGGRGVADLSSGANDPRVDSGGGPRKARHQRAPVETLGRDRRGFRSTRGFKERPRRYGCVSG